MNPVPDPYRVLGLAPGASLDEVKRAYRRLAKQFHPDSAGDAATARFLVVQSAYESLLAGWGRSRTTVWRSSSRAAAGSRPAGGMPGQPGRDGAESPGPRPWEADAARARATREAASGRSSRWRTGGPGPRRPWRPASAGAGQAGAASRERPDRMPSGGSTGERQHRADGVAGGASHGTWTGGAPSNGTTTSDSGTGGRGSATHRSIRKAHLGSTSYDDAEPRDPQWQGATWYGQASGTYWTINPKEYADPRKHGPGYQARGRRTEVDETLRPADGADEGPTRPRTAEATAPEEAGSRPHASAPAAQEAAPAAQEAAPAAQEAATAAQEAATAAQEAVSSSASSRSSVWASAWTSSGSSAPRSGGSEVSDEAPDPSPSPSASPSPSTNAGTDPQGGDPPATAHAPRAGAPAPSPAQASPGAPSAAAQRGEQFASSPASSRSGASLRSPRVERSQDRSAPAPERPHARPPLSPRLLSALVAWPVLGLAAAGLIGQLTGCARYSASCTGGLDLLPLVLQPIILAVLVALPRLAGPAAMGSLAVVMAAVPATVLISASGGSNAPAGEAPTALVVVLAIAWLIGVVAALSGRARLPAVLRAG